MGGSELTSQSDDQRVHRSTMEVEQNNVAYVLYQLHRVPKNVHLLFFE